MLMPPSAACNPWQDPRRATCVVSSPGCTQAQPCVHPEPIYSSILRSGAQLALMLHMSAARLTLLGGHPSDALLFYIVVWQLGLSDLNYIAPGAFADVQLATMVRLHIGLTE